VFPAIGGWSLAHFTVLASWPRQRHYSRPASLSFRS
jgi:hypothetical protein